MIATEKFNDAIHYIRRVCLPRMNSRSYYDSLLLFMIIEIMIHLRAYLIIIRENIVWRIISTTSYRRNLIEPIICVLIIRSWPSSSIRGTSPIRAFLTLLLLLLSSFIYIQLFLQHRSRGIRFPQKLLLIFRRQVCFNICSYSYHIARNSPQGIAQVIYS